MVRQVLFICGAALLLGGCHGSPLDSVYPGSFGHTTPPAANLPAADCPAPKAKAAWPSCLPAPASSPHSAAETTRPVAVSLRATV